MVIGYSTVDYDRDGKSYLFLDDLYANSYILSIFANDINNLFGITPYCAIC